MSIMKKRTNLPQNKDLGGCVNVLIDCVGV